MTIKLALTALLLALPLMALSSARADPCPWCDAARVTPTTLDVALIGN